MISKFRGHSAQQPTSKDCRCGFCTSQTRLQHAIMCKINAMRTVAIRSISYTQSSNRGTQTRMNRNQAIALAVAVANMVLIALFPPIDQYSVASAAVPVFSGFHFIAGKPPLSVVNSDLLAIEMVVVLVNLAIAWLLLQDKPAGTAKRKLSLQNASLILTGANLVLMLLFPPMESVFALTKAAIPTFEGFFFIFAQKPAHVIVETLLYIEVMFILTNGALLWLIFKQRRPPTDREVMAAMRDLRSR